MNAISNQLQNDAWKVDQAMRRFLACPSEDPAIARLYEAMRYSAESGGKRIRPFLTLAFCRLYGGEEPTALTFGCALECIHTYSLIHDDLPCMDNDEERRGKPTNHKAFGEATALLAGDGLLTLGFDLASSVQAVSAEDALLAVRILAEAAGPAGMVGGQMMDLNMTQEAQELDVLEDMNRLKTGRLMRAACRLGALAAGVKNFDLADRYADNIGLLFQLTDDLLDAEEAQSGQKITYLTFLPEDEARFYAQRLASEASYALRDAPRGEELRALADYLVSRTV